MLHFEIKPEIIDWLIHEWMPDPDMARELVEQLMGEMVAHRCIQTGPVEQAAPDLLEALRPLAALWLDAFDRKADDTPIYRLGDAIITVGDVKAARAAIAKAEPHRALPGLE